MARYKEKSMTGLIKKGTDLAASKSFCAVLPRSGVKTMSHLKVPIKVTENRNINDNDVIYMRLMIVNTRKKVPLQQVMAFENTYVLISMFKEDGLMVLPKENKADFTCKVEAMLQTK